MPSITFDRAADYYDLTRGFKEGVAEQIRDAILAYTNATPSTRFLELGVGTGRIALPFILAGYDYTGIDLSLPMMARLESKLAKEPVTPRQARRYKLLQGDVTALPFAANSFEVIIAVHVLHLVDGWQKTLEEAHRVLQQPGFLILAHEQVNPGENISETRPVNRQWYTILEELGVPQNNLLPGLRQQWNREKRDDQLENYLRQLGGQVEDITLLEYTTQPLTPRQLAQRHIDRLYSSDWQLGEAVHAEAARRLQSWLENSCPEPDKPASATSYFKALIATWP